MNVDPTARFAALVARSGVDLPLDEAALLVAAHATPELDVGTEQARLDDLAAGVPTSSLEGLRDHLLAEGFSSAENRYYHPDSSLLDQVLHTRQGIPLSLAIVAIEVGRRCGVRLVGVGMPGHFLCQAEGGGPYLDLYGGGRVLDRTEARAVFERLQPGAAWHDHHLRPVDARSMVIRMLANLAGAYRRLSDREGLRWVLGLRLHLPGATERDRRELAVVLSAAGRYVQAAEVLEATGEERDDLAARRLRARLN